MYVIILFLYMHYAAALHANTYRGCYAYTYRTVRTVQNLVGENFVGFGTARKLMEKTLAVDHTKNNSLYQLTKPPKSFDR